MVTLLEKAEKERDSAKVLIVWLEQKLASNAQVALTEAMVVSYLHQAIAAEAKVNDAFDKIVACAPVDMDPHNQEHLILLDKVQPIIWGLQALKANFASTTPQPSPQIPKTADIRLPRLELPSFDGKIQNWMSFRDMFTATVHNNNNLTKAQKLTYLKSSLTGEAQRQLKSIAVTDDNYDTAWMQLENRYHNERELLFSILRKLFGQSNVPGNSASALRSLIDVSKECICSLKSLKLPVGEWDAIILFILFTKLDQASRELWEHSLTTAAIPPLKGFIEFLEQRARALAAGGIPMSKPNQTKSDATINPQRKVTQAYHVQGSPSCKICKEGHQLFKCPKFISMNSAERQETVKTHSLCFNCLQHGHPVSSCPNKGTCRNCGQRHNTLLHREPNHSSSNPQQLNLHSNEQIHLKQTMLATVVIMVQNKHGQFFPFRALMDGGSNSNFISEGCVKKLGISRSQYNSQVFGLSSSSVGHTRGRTSLVIQTKIPTQEVHSFEALIMTKVTGPLPNQRCDPTAWSHLQGLELADPNFHIPGPIDILLGAEVFYQSILGGKVTGAQNSPLAILTTFGWIVAGNLNSSSTHISVMHTDVSLDQKLQQFWEIENIESERTVSQSEEMCESHFSLTHQRNAEGRFIVELPFKNQPPRLGSSRDIALNRFKQLEARFRRQPERHKQYREFMRQYLSLGHMEMIPPEEIPSLTSCYIPHHYVMKESSSTTKLRVVFDASAKTSNGVCLNDELLVGPTIQNSLTDILTRFRTHPIAFVADITKMYRQFLVHSKHQDYQRILWRDNPNEPITDYRLCTVTYGTASAPFLATRALQQLAIDAKDSHSLAYHPTMNDFYVDNLMTGASTVDKALDMQAEIQALMKLGGMQLSQWSSNSSELLKNIPEDQLETKLNRDIELDPSFKTLGIFWNPISDHFSFKVNLNEIVPHVQLTKRSVLSEVAKIFDPLGWLAPVIIRAKIFMQQLWKIQLGWDDALPHDIQREWLAYRTNLMSIEQVNIPRYMSQGESNRIHLSGFCDASERAYAAVAYLCSYAHDQPPVITLISSKTRVAPAKPISLPRLELCGAVLLSQLLSNIQKNLKISNEDTSAWTDSTVVLSWIKGHPSRWKTFVANRVTEIHNKLPASNWGHVPGTDNPADCASRGIDPCELRDHKLWWTGPSWLRDNKPFQFHDITDDDTNSHAELRQNLISKFPVMSHATSSHIDDLMLHKYSSLLTLVRVTAFCLRFSYNCLIQRQMRKVIFPHQLCDFGPLTPDELNNSLLVWVKLVQREQFSEEVSSLSKGGVLSNKSSIRNLNPFIDAKGVLRVGGRLTNAPMSVDEREPILLPRHHQLTRLLIISEHIKNLHAGPQLLLSIISKRFWIVRARDTIRHQLRKCVTCTKVKAKLQQQFMGSLPSVRVTPSRPFNHCGVDFAGPFLIRPLSPRSKITLKAYLAVFVCYTTHAIHLEIVSELSTPSFIASLNRFISRRGKPHHMYSDCGSNFVGAARKLQENTSLYQSSLHNQVVADELSSNGILWHFNPPGAPHFGGLWEAGVKSVKYHLRRVMGIARLTFEELSTVMCKIEACLNSRPLTPISTNPDDLDALTPGHFLIGTSLISLAEEDLTHEKTSRLNRWQILQQIQQHFWQRWSKEYISRMQQRPKWLKPQRNIKVDDMVIIKDDNLPPLKWKLGRVVQTHPGNDGLVRVVTLKTPTGEMKRPIAKLCLLPIDPDCSINESNQVVRDSTE